MSDATRTATRALTPTASAIAGLVVAASALVAGNAWVFLAQGAAGLISSENDPHAIIPLVGLIEAVVAAIALLLARRALATATPAEPLMTRHLAGATYVVGGLGLVVGVLTCVASLV